MIHVLDLVMESELQVIRNLMKKSSENVENEECIVFIIVAVICALEEKYCLWKLRILCKIKCTH